MATAGRRAAVILDRDGVLNVDQGYVGEVERLEWVAGARRAVRRMNDAGLLVIVATNQSGVARGLFDLAAVNAVHAQMRADLAAEGARIDAFYVCPFLPDAPLRAIAEWSIDPARALVIGDNLRDIEAGRRAGVRGALFPGGDLARFVASLALPK